MVARYEFEVDTTRAVAGWEAEVAENLARPGQTGRAAPAGQPVRARQPTPGTRPHRGGRLAAAGERPDERRTGYRRVECDRCGAAVQVAKFSPQHTIVQWSPESVRACAEFTAGPPAAEPSALIDGCASLRDSIDRAVLQGRLEVSPP